MKKAEEIFIKEVYKGLEKGDTQHVMSIINAYLEREKTDKLKLTPTPLLNSIGDGLGEMLIGKEWSFDRLMNLWREGKRDERLIVVNALGRLSRVDYKNSKSFVLNILNDLSDWEICDQLALRVVVNLAVQNENEMFSLMEEWIKSRNKWVRRLAIATIPPYIRRKKRGSKMCLQILNKVMKEEDEDVKKAIGWALREVTKKYPESVFKFLQKWAKVKDKNVRAIIKAGMKKLQKEEQEEIKSLLGE
ncbi:MAG: DNA alkylation repair protein [archaeon YNP-LCB-024-027]|nr:DNA alkylation repair protein [Candidatus Culexarchaeum yellowstonense]